MNPQIVNSHKYRLLITKSLDLHLTNSRRVNSLILRSENTKCFGVAKGKKISVSHYILNDIL